MAEAGLDGSRDTFRRVGHEQLYIGREHENRPDPPLCRGDDDIYCRL